MKKQVKITIGGKSYPLQFGYGANRRLGELLGEDTYDGTAKRVFEAVNKMAEKENSNGSLPFETLDVLGHMVVCALPDGSDIDRDMAVDAILDDMPKIKEFIDAWSDKMPKGKSAQAEKKSRPRQA